jgi:flagellar motor component MotA
MRPKKRSALIKATLLLELAGHAAMGVAVGLAFAFVVTHITASDITLINHSPTPAAHLLTFVDTCATTFGIGATLTGLVITLTEDHDTNGRK